VGSFGRAGLGSFGRTGLGSFGSVGFGSFGRTEFVGATAWAQERAVSGFWYRGPLAPNASTCFSLDIPSQQHNWSWPGPRLKCFGIREKKLSTGFFALRLVWPKAAKLLSRNGLQQF
jgi:hypothetical protein